MRLKCLFMLTELVEIRCLVFVSCYFQFRFCLWLQEEQSVWGLLAKAKIDALERDVEKATCSKWTV